ncbi:hypothetical protein B296_00014417 [Ensete ventricosum]|uniref:Uncharacterized protein n=1 Tax=Ensete ventricosum TaxID=4639 RepID=A0A426Y9X8_ENSVE|nr:hypothetical protein B296_00014417 [Ensete ventricosum]
MLELMAAATMLATKDGDRAGATMVEEGHQSAKWTNGVGGYNLGLRGSNSDMLLATMLMAMAKRRIGAAKCCWQRRQMQGRVAVDADSKEGKDSDGGSARQQEAVAMMGSVFKQTLGLTFFLFRLPRLKGSPISLLPSRSSGLLISFFPQSLLEIDPFEPSHSQSPANSLRVPSLKRVFLRPSICFAFKKPPEEERIGDHRVLFAPIEFSWSQLARVPVPGTLDLAVGAPEALLGSFDWGPSGCSGA